MFLAFDTSGPYCSVAVYDGVDIVAAAHQDMARGQAEHLMPLISETLAQAGQPPNDLAGIGVGIGPGNFTGIRISVSAARGMALGLGIPAHGVSLLEALALDQPGPMIAALTAPRNKAYVQRFQNGVAHGPPENIEIAGFQAPPDTLFVGSAAQALADETGGTLAAAAYAPASAVARIAATRPDTKVPRPAPLYLREADAAPPREPAPTIVP